MGRAVTLHHPQRPSWVCSGCGDLWPCHTRRLELLAEYTGAVISLGLNMAAHFIDACVDLPGHLAGDLHGRFLGWIRGRGGRS